MIGKTKFIYFMIYLVLLTIFLCFLAEVFLRVCGVRPWRPEGAKILVEPGGTFFRKDPRLGFTHLPGEFTVTIQDRYFFHVTHLNNTLRITHPLASYSETNTKPEIWIFGCSFTYGWTLNDEKTFPWRLQEEMPAYEVVNFGVNGYSSLQSFLQFQEALKQKKPRLVVATYASFHDERNVFSRKRRKTVAPWNRLGILELPYARLDHEGRLSYFTGKAEYSEIPWMRHSSLVHTMEKGYNAVEDFFYHSHEISKAILREWQALCKREGIPFVVAGITADSKTKEMLQYCDRQGIMAVDISVNLRNRANVSLPSIDNHPNAIADKQYAEKLYAFLKSRNF